LITALSSIGSSRQKQILRMAGTFAGGVIFGMGAQVSLLPRMDSITAFTLFFASVTAIAAWFATSSARISYFGLQLALAFFLINLQEFAFQTSLTIARDRVLGVLLALFVMWIVFDLLGGVPAVNQMLAQFQRVLLRLAELEDLSLASDAEIISTREQEIREELVGTFAAINAEADAVLLETGPHRSEHLLLRKRILPLLPSLRSLLLLQVTALQYRRQRLIRDLPPPLAVAHQNFARAVAGFLRDLASTYPAKPALPEFRALDDLHKAVKDFYNQTTAGVLPSTVIALEALADSIASTLKSMQSENHLAG
jgi:multidrug resistance protein MdtO